MKWPLVTLLATAGLSFAATADEAIWPSDVRRVDPAKQSYERLPSRAQAAPTASGQKPASFRPTGFFRVLDSTSFHYKGQRYRMAGITPVPNNKICVKDDGIRWACGLAARNELSKMIKASGVHCVPLAKGTDVVEVRCGDDVSDLAEQLVARGFATPREPSPPR